ncbi:MAG: hypothetical protein KDB26_14245 [Microthrixaceae bacterium]|nr:hypothetical protein [Microthrixaceae bacterium]
MILGVGFPNPVGWTVDKVTGFVSGTAAAGFEAVIGGLTAWIVDAVIWVVGGVFNFFLDATDPNVQADWFVTGHGPYATTAGIGASLLLLFVLAGIVQGAMSGDVGGMLRRVALELPVSILGMIGLVTLTQVLIRLTDALSGQVLDNFQSDIDEFTSVVASLNMLTGGQATAFVIFVLGLVTVLAGLVLVAELVVRAALIYIVVALAPLVFATRLWPATKGMSRKLLDLLVALILSKLVIAIALAVAAAAAVGTGSGGELTSLPRPEVFAEDPGGSVTQAVGILLTAAAAFGVAAFSPMLIARLLPLTEAAVVAQGVKGGPVRAGHQGMMMANTMQMVSGHRYSQIANGRAAVGAGAGSPPAAGAGTRTSVGSGAGAGGPVAAAGPLVVAAVATETAKKAATTGAKAATGTAQAATSQPSQAPHSERQSQAGDSYPPVAPPGGTSHPPSISNDSACPALTRPESTTPKLKQPPGSSNGE